MASPNVYHACPFSQSRLRPPPPPQHPRSIFLRTVLSLVQWCAKWKDIPRDSLDCMSTRARVCVCVCVCVRGGVGGGRVRYVCWGNTDIVFLPLCLILLIVL